MIGWRTRFLGGGHRRSKKRKSNSNKSKKNKHKRKYSIRKNKRSTRKHKSRKYKKLIGGLKADEIDDTILTEMTEMMDPSIKGNQDILNLRKGEIRGRILSEINEINIVGGAPPERGYLELYNSLSEMKKAVVEKASPSGRRN